MKTDVGGCVHSIHSWIHVPCHVTSHKPQFTCNAIFQNYKLAAPQIGRLILCGMSSYLYIRELELKFGTPCNILTWITTLWTINVISRDSSSGIQCQFSGIIYNTEYKGLVEFGDKYIDKYKIFPNMLLLDLGWRHT